MELQKVIGDAALIEKMGELAVQVEGAVLEVGTHLVKPGTRVCDLKKRLSLLPNADASCLKQRRFLQAGEKIFITCKNE